MKAVARPVAVVVESSDSHSLGTTSLFFSVPLVIVALEILVILVGPGLTMGPPGFAEEVVACRAGGSNGIISKYSITSGG